MEEWTPTVLSYEEASSTLKKWREEHARRAEDVVEIWEFVLSRYCAALGDELWVVLEQVAIAALDQARHDLAIDCIQQLHQQFPKSMRVTKLQAMRLEAIGNYEDADKLYEKLIEADEINPVFRKRRIAILIAKGDRQAAIRELNKYLESFGTDTEAWLQLSELFLQEGDYTRAAFCFEELILSNPHNACYLQKMAEIRYTLGGQENIEMARNYYEKSVSISSSAASLYGLVLCYNQLVQKATGQRKHELIIAGQNACDRLLVLYNNKETLESSSNELIERQPNLDKQIDVIKFLKSCFKE